MSAEQHFSAQQGTATAVEGPHWDPPAAPLDMPTQALEAEPGHFRLLRFAWMPMFRLRG